MAKIAWCFLLLFSLSSVGFSEGLSNKGQAIATATGRYVFGQVSEFRADQFLLDTKTGRLWQIVLSEDKAKVLQPVFYALGEGQYSVDAEGVLRVSLKNELPPFPQGQSTP